MPLTMQILAIIERALIIVLLLVIIRNMVRNGSDNRPNWR